ncbi:FAD-binding oxidoreductase [Streptomyces sp. NPDC055085]
MFQHGGIRPRWSLRAFSERDAMSLITRRTLLGTGAATAVGALVAAPGRLAQATPLAPSAAPPGVADRAAWRDLRRRLSAGARLYRPGDEGFSARATGDNQRYAAVRPAGVLACADEDDVRTAVAWCARNAVPFAPRSGGHSYAGYSTTTGLVISLRAMNHVQVEGRRLRLGGGATNSDVYAARAAGLYFPGGRCPGVGVAGLTLGGGIGFNDRKWGLTCDRLTETRIVLADGSLVRAAADENSALFWAMRGGAGGNFGINTAFVFDAVPVQRQRATVYDLAFPLSRAAKVLEEFQQLLADDRHHDLDARIGFRNSGTGTATLVLLGQYLGPEDTLRRLFGRLLTLRPTRQFIEERSFWYAQDYLLEKPGTPDCYASKSLVPTCRLDAAAVAEITAWIRGWDPGPARSTGYVTLFAMGGSSGDVRNDETAYPHRDATFVIDIGTHWKPGTPAGQVDALLAQTRAVHHTLSRRLATTAAYVNFPDPDLADWRQAYYGPNYQRLTRVKHRYDPTGSFHYGQSIAPRA